MRALPKTLILAVCDDEGYDVDSPRLPVAGATRDGLAFHGFNVRTVAHDGVGENDVARVRQVEAGKAFFKAKQEDTAALKFGDSECPLPHASLQR